MQQVDLIIRSGRVYTMDVDRRIYPDGALAILGNNIVHVGTTDEIVSRYEAASVIDASRHLVMPGLVDTHRHPVLNFVSAATRDTAPISYYPHVPGQPDPTMALDETIAADPLSRISHGPTRDHFDGFLAQIDLLDKIPPIATYSLARHSLACAVRAGATTFVEGGGGDVDGIAEAALSVGIRAGLAYPAFDTLVDLQQPAGGMQRVRDTDNVLAAAEEAALRWHGRSDGLISGWLAPVTDVTCSDELLSGMRALAERHGFPVMSHCAAAASHNAYSEHHYGRSCVSRMLHHGLLEQHWLGIHIGFFSQEELRALMSRSAFIAHCPSTSALCGKGILGNGMIMQAMRHGVVVGLGTDTNIVGNMIREMVIAYAGHKEALGDSRALPAYKVLQLATSDGARAVALEGRTGKLEPGHAADVITIDIDRPEFDDVDPISALMIHGQSSDVRDSVINGRIVLRNRELTLVDEDEIRRDKRAANALLSRMAL